MNFHKITKLLSSRSELFQKILNSSPDEAPILSKQIFISNSAILYYKDIQSYVKKSKFVQICHSQFYTKI